MITALIFLAATNVAPAPAATPTPTPTLVKAATNGQARTLADVARERKLGAKAGTGGFSAAKTTVVPSTAAMTDQDRHLRDFGEPKSRNVTMTISNDGALHTHEQWIYDFGYVYFTDGRESGFQYSRVNTSK